MEVGGDDLTLKALEKQVRILTKRLERSEADRQQLEDASEQRERILKGVIREFEASQMALEGRSRQLEQALGDLKSLQVKLIESEKMSALRVLVAGIAHEINNPINFIHGNLKHVYSYTQGLLALVQTYQQLVSQPPAALQKQIKDLDLAFLIRDLPKLLRSMQIGTERIGEIVRSLRNFSRLDEADCKAVDLHEGLDSTLLVLQHRFEATADRSAIQIIKGYGDLPLVECYAGQLNQVFLHLLSNAIDAIDERSEQNTNPENTNLENTNPENTNPENINPENINPENTNTIHTILLKTETIGQDRIKIMITDNGTGIPELLRSHIFNPFFTTKPIGKGTGLGLSVCYQIITENHNGQLSCHSTLGEGTTFAIEIPIQQSKLE